MSGTNSSYVSSIAIDPFFIDKSTGQPLANGKVYFYQDSNRTSPKAVYQLVQGTGSPPNYSYAVLPNPLTLSAVGTVVNSSGDDVALYYYPYDSNGNLQLYYVEVYDANGLLQYTREAWPFPSAASGGGGGSSSNQFGISNQLTNPQFSIVNFVSPTLTYHYSGAGTSTIAIAPGWVLSVTYTGAGTLTITQTAVSGQSRLPNNPPYTLDFNAGANITALQLYQQFSNNPDWAAPQTSGVNGYIAASICLSTGTTATVQYVASSGNTTPQTIINATNTSGAYETFTGTIQLLQANNSQNGSQGYDRILINLPTSGTSSVANVQVCALNNNIADVAFEQTTSNRNLDRMFNYYNSLLQAKAIPSWLIGWNFPLNPAAALGNASLAAQATGANSAYYSWDQTIVFQTTNSGITISRDGTGALKTLSANAAGTQLALIQYLPANEVIEMLSRRKCVMVCANASVATTATISLWYLKGTTTLPSTVTSHQSIVATLDSKGYPATLTTPPAGTWVQIPRSGLSNASVTTSATNAAEFTIGVAPAGASNFNQYSFAGWDMQGSTDINNATFFAIVIGTASLAQNAYILWQAITCQDGDIPTIPAAQSLDEVARQCRRYYFSSFPVGTAPAPAAGLTNSYVFTADGAGASVERTNSWFYPYDMYQIPNITIYNPVNNNNQVYNRTRSEDCSAAGVTTNYPSNFTISCTGSASTQVSDDLQFHFVADARLGQ